MHDCRHRLHTGRSSASSSSGVTLPDVGVEILALLCVNVFEKVPVLLFARGQLPMRFRQSCGSYATPADRTA